MIRNPPAQAQRQVGITYIGPFSTDNFNHVLDFLHVLLVKTAAPQSQVNFGKHDWKVSDAETRASLAALLKSFHNQMEVDNAQGIRNYLEIIEIVLKNANVDAGLQANASGLLLELITLSPSSFVLKYSENAEWLKNLLPSVRLETRINCANALGILYTSNIGSPQGLESYLGIWREMIGCSSETKATVESRQGALLCLGFLFSRAIYRNQTSWRQFITSDMINEVFGLLEAEIIKGSNSVVAASLAVAEIGRYTPLSSVVPSTAVWTGLFDHMTRIIKESKEVKLQETCIQVLSHVGTGDASLRTEIFDFFLTLPGVFSSQPEMHFAVGEAFACLCGGLKSKNMAQYLDISDAIINQAQDEVLTQKYLDWCFKECSPSAKLVNRKAVCIWLVSLISNLQIANLKEVHSAFLLMLGDRDEFIQEIASKGIGIVYQQGNADLRQELVGSLVGLLQDGKKIAPQSVSGDTQLFDQSQLGETPDGSGITTYQSILSLATEMNQPDLIYKFMGLASHHAIWNSRKGASLGVAHLLSFSDIDIEAHFSHVIPKLYRFTFDPNPKVSAAMRNIWTTLVKDEAKLLDRKFADIITDLLTTMGDKTWRSREASCKAVADLIGGRDLALVSPFIQKVWAACFRALDDIKESVRVAAFSTCKSLTLSTLRFCDPEYTPVSKGQHVMDSVLPFLLDKGLMSMSEDVRKYSLGLLLKLIKKNDLLVPHAASVVAVFLESLSGLEPQYVNYLSFHIEKYNVSKDQLDSSRLSATKSSPMMQAVEICIQVARDKKLLVEKIVTVSKKGVGLPSKAGCARAIVLCCSNWKEDIKPFTNELVKACKFGLRDTSFAVKKVYANALANVLRHASDEFLFKYIDSLQASYLSEEEDKTIPALVLNEVVTVCRERAESAKASIVPVVFLGRQDPDASRAALFSKTWEEIAPSPLSTLKLYFSETMDLCIFFLKESGSWDVKRQVGKAVAELSKTIKTSDFYTNQEKVKGYIDSLLDALVGRTWEGKEFLLEANAEFCRLFGELLKKEANLMEKAVSLMVKECKKKNLEYKKAAIEQTASLVDALCFDAYNEMKPIILDVLQEDSMDEDDEEDKRKRETVKYDIFAACFVALGLVWNQKVDKDELKTLSNLLLDHYQRGYPLNVRKAIFQALERLLEKDPPVSSESIGAILDLCLKGCLEFKFLNLREAACLSLEKACKYIDILPHNNSAKLCVTLEDAIAKETANHIKDKLSICLGLLKH